MAPSSRACQPGRWRPTSPRCASCGRSSLSESLELRRIGVELARAQLLSRRGGKLRVAAQVTLELLVFELLEVEQRIVRALGGADELVQLDLDRLGIAVLRVLDQKHHEKRDDGRRGIDHQLPCVAEMEDRTAERPEHHRSARDEKCHRSSGQYGELAGEV